ncbi:hypothetical protein ACS0TY_034689 [Phlomoides rotata]
MATSSIIFVLQLLFLATGNLLLAAPVDDVCRQTREPPRCVAVLKGTDTRTPTATLPVLEEIAIEAAQTTGGQTKIAVQNLAIFAKDPKLKKIYQNCEDLFRDALDELGFALENLQKRRFAELVRTAEIVGRVVGGCAAAVRSKAGLKRGVDDTGVVAEAIGIIARKL